MEQIYNAMFKMFDKRLLLQTQLRAPHTLSKFIKENRTLCQQEYSYKPNTENSYNQKRTYKNWKY